MSTIDTKLLTKNLKIDAKAVGIPVGAAEIFIDKTLKAAQTALKSKTIITNEDLNRAITKELKKYNPDLVYVYENRDKII